MCERLLHNSPTVSRAILAIVAVTQLAFAATASAQAQMEFIPSVSLFTVYDDNIFARVTGSAGQMQQLRPSFEGSYESPTVRMLGLYSFDMQRSNFSSLNTLDARRHALGETRLRTNPFTTLGVTGRYDRSEVPGDIDVDTGSLGERRTAERLELTPTFARRVSTRTVISTAYNWTTEHLVDGERGTLHTGRVGWSQDITSKTTIGGSYVARYFVDHRANHSSHAALLSWNRVLGPGMRVTLSAGPKITSYGGADLETSAAFARATPHANLALDYWHGETIVLGVLGPVGVDSLSSRMSWPIKRRFEFGTHTGVSDISAIDGRTSRIYRGTLVGSWAPHPMYTVATTYGLDLQDGTIRQPLFLDDQPLPLDDHVLRQVFRVSVTVAPRYKRSILPPEEAARAKGVTR